MGPHSFECGNETRQLIPMLFEVTLQWGRTRSSAEMPADDADAPLAGAASMGPHSFECGNPSSS